MSLITDIKKLRELEQKAKKDYVENGNWYRYNAEKLAPAMLSVLECFRVGDAEAIEDLLSNWTYSIEHPGLAALHRLQKAASLMEQEERER